MKIKKNVEMPNRIGNASRISEASLAVIEFVDSEDANLKFECGNEQEAKRVYSTVSGTARRLGLPVRVSKSMNDIYVLHKEG